MTTMIYNKADDPMTPEQLALMEEWYPFAMSVARNYYYSLRRQRHRMPDYRMMTLEEMQSIAVVGLVRAMRRLEEYEVGQQRSYVGICVLGQLKDEHRRWQGLRRRSDHRIVEQPMSTLANKDGLDDWQVSWIEQEHFCDTDSDPSTFNDGTDSFEQIISKLGGKNRVVFRMYYRYGYTMKQIGDQLGMSESRVSQLHSDAILTLKAIWQDRLHILFG